MAKGSRTVTGATEDVAVTMVEVGDDVLLPMGVGGIWVRVDDVETGTARVRSTSTGLVRVFPCRVLRHRHGTASFAETETVLRVRSAGSAGGGRP